MVLPRRHCSRPVADPRFVRFRVRLPWWQGDGGQAWGAQIGRPSLRCGSPVLLGPEARGRTPSAHCVRCGRTAAASQFTKRAGARGLGPCDARRPQWAPQACPPPPCGCSVACGATGMPVACRSAARPTRQTCWSPPPGGGLAGCGRTNWSPFLEGARGSRTLGRQTPSGQRPLGVENGHHAPHRLVTGYSPCGRHSRMATISAMLENSATLGARKPV